MSVLFVLIPLSLLMGIGALVFFARSAQQGDFEKPDSVWSNILDLKEKKDE